MYDKLRTIQKMLRDQILKFEKLEKKHNKLEIKLTDTLEKNEALIVINEQLKQENEKLIESLNKMQEKQIELRRPHGKSKHTTK